MALHPTRPSAPRQRRPAEAPRCDELGALRALGFGPPGRRRHRAVARLRTTTATSAGGVVVRHEEGRRHLVVGMRRRERDAVTWTLPKGTPHPGESREETAVREVEEETGLEVRIIAPLGSIDYRFVQRGLRIHKTVHYFLMEPTGGDLGRHDREFDEVRWVSFDDASGLLTFETERALVARAAEHLSEPDATGTGDGGALESGQASSDVRG